MDSQFSFSLDGPDGLLLNKGIDYLTANNLKANYVNMAIPTTTSVITSSTARSTTSEDITEDDNAVLSFYTCQFINPDHEVGVTEEKATSVEIGGQ